MSRYTFLSFLKGSNVDKGRGIDNVDNKLGRLEENRCMNSSDSDAIRVKSALGDTAYTFRILTMSITRAFLQ